jgi:transcriptional regulator with XRE-family HTH domain
VRRVQALKAKGLTSPQIGKKLGIAPSTVRDYLNDPDRSKARRRQLTYAVEPAIQLNGGEVTAIHKTAKFTPHKGKGRGHNAARSRQMQAVIGWGARKG